MGEFLDIQVSVFSNYLSVLVLCGLVLFPWTIKIDQSNSFAQQCKPIKHIIFSCGWIFLFSLWSNHTHFNHLLKYWVHCFVEGPCSRFLSSFSPKLVPLCNGTIGHCKCTNVPWICCGVNSRSNHYLNVRIISTILEMKSNGVLLWNVQPFHVYSP